MPGQRNHVFPVLVTLLAVLCPPSFGTAAAPEIIPPDPLAVELPAGVTSLGVDDPAVTALIAGARAEPGMRISASLPKDRIGVGVWRVIWSAWDSDRRDRPVARRESYLYVVPHGMTPVAMSGKTDAIAGNNATHIARDSAGFVHMVWTDSWRPGARDGGLYRRARVLPDGTARFETDSLDLGTHPSNWTAIPALAVAGDTVHFAWQSDGTVRYRSVTHTGDEWRWSEEIDTMAPAPGRDTGPSIAADASAIHILTPAGVYTVSRDGGRTWTSEPMSLGTDGHGKTLSLTIDNEGRPLVAASWVVVSPAKLSEDHGHGGYWTLRLARRTGPGIWQSIASPVQGRPEWATPSRPDEDVLCDWVRVLEDRLGGLHLTWHGTAVSRIYGNDRAYYAWRSPDGAWRAPISLREPDPSRGLGWSYAPGLTLDGDRALTLVFYSARSGRQERGFDSELGLFREGRSLAQALPVTRFARDSVIAGEPRNALSAWFPGAAPSLVRDSDGRVWADILLCLAPTGVTAPALIVWQRLELSAWLKSAGQ